MGPDRRVYADGAVAIEGRKIAAIGRTEEVLAKYAGKQRTEVDARRRIVMPGLIDGHFHPFNFLVGGHGDDLEIGDLLYKVFYPFEKSVTDEDARLGAMAGFVEMIKSGVTTFNDPGGYKPDLIARAAAEIGIRGIVARSTRDLPPPGKADTGLYDNTDTALAEAERLVQTWNEPADGRLRAWCALRVSYEVSDRLVEGIRDLARKYSVGVHAHASSLPFENRACESIFKKRAIPRYRDLGVLGPNFYAVHMGDLTTEEIDITREFDVKVSHCPVASLTGGWGIIKSKTIPNLIKAGVTVSLGTDTNFGSGSMDFFRVMFTFATAHRETHDDPTLVGAHKALASATIEGARACLWDDEIGSLEVGKCADIIMLGNDDWQWRYPGRDVARNIVYGGNAACVNSSWINGKLVMCDRKVLTIDERALQESVEATSRTLAERTGFKPRHIWPLG